MSLRRHLVALLAVLALAGLLVALGALWTARGGLPQRSGEVAIEGSRAEVRVRWDEWAVPHLDGDSLVDLAAAMGWIHANDRFFQLETGRRQADGRLAELFGDAALPADRHFRRLRFSHLARAYAEALGAEARRLLEAYARGVNAWLRTHRDDLPPELRVLGVEPEPWSLVDSAKFQLLLAHELSFWAGRPEEDRLRLLDALGPGRLADLMGAPVLLASPGSNNWALATGRTDTGGPLLASDPHLPLRLPGFWYQARLHAPDYRAQGMTLVGFPFVVIGQGPSLAWAFTNTMLDDHDLFVEELDEAGERVRREHGWQPIRSEEQKIRSRDGGVESIRVEWTDIGPLLPADPERGLPPRSLEWTGLRAGDLTEVFLRLARADRVEELPGELESWVSPAQNLVAADRHGGLLFTVVGRVPDRGASDGRLPVPAVDERYRWHGLRPQAANPTVLDPDDGLLITANNDIRPPGFREPFLPLVADFDTPHRARRIRELLLQRGSWSLEGLGSVQNDVVSSYALEVVELLDGAYPGDAGRALAVLRDWNGSMSHRGTPALFAWLERTLLTRALHDETAAAGLPPAAGREQLLRLLRGEMREDWWDDAATGPVEDRGTIVAAALEEAWRQVTERWGPVPGGWNYGSMHTLSLNHPLGTLPLVGRWFARGPIPMPGSATTVAAFGARWTGDTKTVAYGPSMRWLADPIDPDRSRAVLPAGQSGHPADPHYDDQLDDWLRGRTHDVHWSDDAVEAATVDRLRLVPGPRAVARSAPRRLDLLVTDGRIADGSGRPARAGAVGVIGDRIAWIGKADAAPPADRTLDAGGLLVIPGFIDVHTHALAAADSPDRAHARNFLAQGVTTVVAGNDGGGPIEVEATLTRMEAHGLGVNMALLVGHDSVRRAILGEADRAPDDAELERMEALVETAMREGAFGLSTGLFYPTGFYADTDEVIALARVSARHGGLYDTHLRDEDSYTVGLLAAVDEAIAIGRASGAAVHIAHLKALGPSSWGLSEQVIDRIAHARADGIHVTADQYPYRASSTTIRGALVPRWAVADGTAAFAARADDPATRRRLLAEIGENVRRRAGADALRIARGPELPPLGSVDGWTLAEIATGLGVSPARAALRIERAGGASVVSFIMDPEDIRRIRGRHWVMTASDGGLVLGGEGVPHPRSYGTFPRAFHGFAVEEGLLTVEEIVRAGTALPAALYGLEDRGRIRVGTRADLAVIDPERYASPATFAEPHALAQGVEWVLVNGELAVERGAVTGIRAGRGLRRGGAG